MVLLTLMAQEALIKAGKKLGVDVRIETNGSEGVKDRLTPEEIKRAKGVVIASDKKVEMPRFDGKELVMKPVVDGINHPQELIEDILENKVRFIMLIVMLVLTMIVPKKTRLMGFDLQELNEWY